MKAFFALTVLGLLLVSAPPVQAQTLGGFQEVEATGISYHRFVRSGEATLQVLVLGTVRSPGIYEVGVGTDLGQLLVMAGGPDLGARPREEKRQTTLRVFRQVTGQRTLLYEAPFEQMVIETGLYPALQDGDMLTVETIVEVKPRFGWRDGLNIVTGVAALGIAVERLIRVFN